MHVQRQEIVSTTISMHLLTARTLQAFKQHDRPAWLMLLFVHSDQPRLAECMTS